jgi:[ribosomal protein S5]-alanine N-acetyltransferase
VPRPRRHDPQRHAVRVVLRAPVAADRDEYLALRDASREHLREWEATPPDGMDVFGPQVFDRFLTSAATETSHRYLVCLVSDGRIAGQVSLSNLTRWPFLSCTLGYWIGAAFARQGLMREALILAIGKAFGEFGLHRVEANIVPENAASKALVKSLGFRFEGLAERYLHINGKWRDHERWSLTAEEIPGLNA